MTGRPTTKRIAIGAALLAGRAMRQEKNVRRDFLNDYSGVMRALNEAQRAGN